MVVCGLMVRFRILCGLSIRDVQVNALFVTVVVDFVINIALVRDYVVLC